MNIFKTPDSYSDMRPSVVTVGNFDGVHRGHELLISETVSRARLSGGPSLAVTFEPHTRSVVQQSGQPVLSTFEEKVILLQRTGIDNLICVPFNTSVQNLTPQEFIEQILVTKLRATAMVMGSNHMFGKNRAGNKNSLHKTPGRNDISLFPVNLHGDRERPFSSTDIRTLLISGELQRAVEILGHPYLIRAQRVSGIKVGTKIGFPTLNFSRPGPEKIIPPAGVFAAQMEFNGELFKGALYFGDCPTFGNRDVHFEFHLLDPVKDVPDIGEWASLWISRFIRPDQTFPTQEDLVKQIKKDTISISQFFDRS